jgi:outer membrane receptor for ferrienterochelin and colicin
VVKDNSVLIVTDSAQFGYYRPNNLFGLESLLEFKSTKKFNLIGGIVIEKENLAESYAITQSNSPVERPPHPARPKMKHSILFSGYLQTQYMLFKEVRFTAGIRFDTSSVYGEVFTPRLGLVGNWKRWTVKLLYNEAFRAPKPWDYTDGVGNPYLDPERMKSLELFTDFHISSHLGISLSLYKNELHGLLRREFIGENWRWINSGELNTNGLELTLDYAKGRTKSYCNYTYNVSTYTNGEKVPEISPHTANMGILFSFGKHIKLDIGGNYLGKRKNVKIIAATGSDMIADAFILHSTLSILGVKGFDFHLIVKNLGDTEYYHSSNRPPDRYRQPQRTIMIKVEYKF